MDWSAPNLPQTKPNTGAAPSNRRRHQPTAANLNLDPKLQHELSKLDRKAHATTAACQSDVPFKPKTRYLHHTWAQTFFSRPELFFQPSSIPEITKIVTLARRCRKRVCVTGYGHSPSTLTCTSSWLVNLDNFAQVLEWDVDGKPGRVRFEAGISLHNLNQALASKGFTLPNLGSIDVQSLAGAISTGTHGSSLHHGLLSQSITAVTIMLSNSQLVTCSAQRNPELFRAALCSLGSLGIIVEITFQAVPEFNIHWTQKLIPLSSVLSTWPDALWTENEYTRVWWLPYLQRAVVWSAVRTTAKPVPPKETFYGGLFGYYVYHNLLAISNYVPSILPYIEWFIFGMQYGFQPNTVTATAVQPAREGLLMNCLYSQFVNEWALPLHRGPEAITRLSAWLNGDEAKANIPFSSKGLYVHCPIEVRVSDTNLGSLTNKNNASGVRPYLDPTSHDGPTLYLNATLYRPYGRDPPCHERYYEAFEWLMKELGGRPHWAKNFAYTDKKDIEGMYGEDMKSFMKVRDESDPQGMFLGDWHVRNLPVNPAILSPRSSADNNGGGAASEKVKACHSLVETELRRRKMGLGWGDGVLWEGTRLVDDEDDERIVLSDEEGNESGQQTPDEKMYGSVISNASNTTFGTMTSRASEESFDLVAKGEASVYAG